MDTGPGDDVGRSRGLRSGDIVHLHFSDTMLLVPGARGHRSCLRLRIDATQLNARQRQSCWIVRRAPLWNCGAEGLLCPKFFGGLL